MTVIDLPRTEVELHEGEPPHEEEVCHLMTDEGLPLCGTRAWWGLRPEDIDGDPTDSPCECSLQRCSECAAAYVEEIVG
jgi:hypothetical protein